MIVAYLGDRRPGETSAEQLFARVHAPHGGLTRGAVTHVVASAARRAGMAPFYAHRLRHTAATNVA